MSRVLRTPHSQGDDTNEQVSVDDVVVLNKEHARLEHLSLTLVEAKALLLELQRQVLTRQIAAFLASRVPCPTCGRARGFKDHQAIVQAALEHTKWNLWHGKVKRAREWLWQLEWRGG